jgi:regulator of protease activity HflC (stomatin/prohibitin superfamily)
MNRIIKLSVIAAAVALTSACTRIETGEVGLRRGFDKQVSGQELLPGSFNQTLIGEVLTFPIKDVSVKVEDMTPLAKDNSTMKDFDALVVYSINQANVSDLYNTKNKSFHAVHNGDVYLMYNYIFNAARNAIYKSSRKFDALDMADNRQVMENEIRDIIIKTLAEEKLDGMINVSQVMIRQIVPADSVVASANELVRAKNEYKQKTVEVETAKKEAERIAALNSNAGAIQYMDAQTRMNLAEAAKIQAQGIANFKGQTLVIGGNANVNVGNSK